MLDRKLYHTGLSGTSAAHSLQERCSMPVNLLLSVLLTYSVGKVLGRWHRFSKSAHMNAGWWSSALKATAKSMVIITGVRFIGQLRGCLWNVGVDNRRVCFFAKGWIFGESCGVFSSFTKVD